MTTSCMEGTFVLDHVFLLEKTVLLGSRRDAALRVGRERFGKSVWFDSGAPSGTERVGCRGKELLRPSGRDTNRTFGVQGEFRRDVMSG